MNANELADLKEFEKMLSVGYLPAVKQAIEMLCQQKAEIEALKSLNTMMKDAIEKRIEMDAARYQWLRAEFAAGRETYLAEGIPNGEELDKYIDRKAQEK